MSAPLPGYVVIENNQGDGAFLVIGKKWSRDYGQAKELAGREGGLVASRNWIAQKQGGDPVAKFGLVEVLAPPPKSHKKKKGGSK